MKGLVMASSDNWQAQSDARTLVEAQQIRNDPKRLKAAMAEVKKQADDLAALSGDDDGDADDTSKSGVKDGQL